MASIGDYARSVLDDVEKADKWDKQFANPAEEAAFVQLKRDIAFNNDSPITDGNVIGYVQRMVAQLSRPGLTSYSPFLQKINGFLEDIKGPGLLSSIEVGIQSRRIRFGVIYIKGTITISIIKRKIISILQPEYSDPILEDDISLRCEGRRTFKQFEEGDLEKIINLQKNLVFLPKMSFSSRLKKQPRPIPSPVLLSPSAIAATASTPIFNFRYYINKFKWTFLGIVIGAITFAIPPIAACALYILIGTTVAGAGIDVTVCACGNNSTPQSSQYRSAPPPANRARAASVQPNGGESKGEVRQAQILRRFTEARGIQSLRTGTGTSAMGAVSTSPVAIRGVATSILVAGSWPPKHFVNIRDRKEGDQRAAVVRSL